jgi:hypothetical protein
MKSALNTRAEVMIEITINVYKASLEERRELIKIRALEVFRELDIKRDPADAPIYILVGEGQEYGLGLLRVTRDLKVRDHITISSDVLAEQLL